MTVLQWAHEKQLALEARRDRPLVKRFKNVAKALLGREG